MFDAQLVQAIFELILKLTTFISDQVQGEPYRFADLRTS